MLLSYINMSNSIHSNNSTDHIQSGKEIQFINKINDNFISEVKSEYISNSFVENKIINSVELVNSKEKISDKCTFLLHKREGSNDLYDFEEINDNCPFHSKPIFLEVKEKNTKEEKTKNNELIENEKNYKEEEVKEKKNSEDFCGGLLLNTKKDIKCKKILNNKVRIIIPEDKSPKIDSLKLDLDNLLITNSKRSEKHKSKKQIIKERLENYSDEEYKKDLDDLLHDPAHKFMFENFPKAYTKYEVMISIKDMKEKRKKKEFFINKDMLDKKYNIYNNKNLLSEFSLDNRKEIEKIDNIQNRNSNNNNKSFVNLSKQKLWDGYNKITDKELDYYYRQLQIIWPFKVCDLIYEYVLEFLKNNNYDINLSLSKISECVAHCKIRIMNIKSNDYEKAINENKKYNMRSKK